MTRLTLDIRLFVQSRSSSQGRRDVPTAAFERARASHGGSAVVCRFWRSEAIRFSGWSAVAKTRQSWEDVKQDADDQFDSTAPSLAWGCSWIAPPSAPASMLVLPFPARASRGRRIPRLWMKPTLIPTFDHSSPSFVVLQICSIIRPCESRPSIIVKNQT